MNTAWKNNNSLISDKEAFINSKMDKIMKSLNAEDLSSNDSIMKEVHFGEAMRKRPRRK